MSHPDPRPVDHIDPITGYPSARDGHLLDTISEQDGTPIEGWDRVGTGLLPFTDPYGALQFVNGSSDDFLCMDYAIIQDGPRGRFIIMHSTRNSETSHSIEDGSYTVLPVNNSKECVQAVRHAMCMFDDAFEEVPHSRRAWNQDTDYFLRAVARSLFPWRFAKFTDRQMRCGGKRIDALVRDILIGTPDAVMASDRRKS